MEKSSEKSKNQKLMSKIQFFLSALHAAITRLWATRQTILILIGQISLDLVSFFSFDYEPVTGFTVQLCKITCACEQREEKSIKFLQFLLFLLYETRFWIYCLLGSFLSLFLRLVWFTSELMLKQKSSYLPFHSFFYPYFLNITSSQSLSPHPLLRFAHKYEKRQKVFLLLGDGNANIV